MGYEGLDPRVHTDSNVQCMLSGFDVWNIKTRWVWCSVKGQKHMKTKVRRLTSWTVVVRHGPISVQSNTDLATLLFLELFTVEFCCVSMRKNDTMSGTAQCQCRRTDTWGGFVFRESIVWNGSWGNDGKIGSTEPMSKCEIKILIIWIVTAIGRTSKAPWKSLLRENGCDRWNDPERIRLGHNQG